MESRLLAILLVLPLVIACPLTPPPAEPGPVSYRPGRMFDSAVSVLRRQYYDTAFVHAHLDALREEFRPAAVAASDDSVEREVIRQFLGHFPASHLALLSAQERDAIWYDLAGEAHLMFGMQLIESNGRYFASMVLTGGPAYTAGIRDGDEIAAIDSVPPARSRHRDWREDDIYLPDERDPPTYGLRWVPGPPLDLLVVRAPGGDSTVIRVSPGTYSALDATRASIRVITRDSVRVGYIRWWYMHTSGLVAGFRKALQGPLALSQALVLDLRGRGGSETAVLDVLRLLAPGKKRRFNGPIVALIDRQTRSAKERLAYELRAQGLGRLVGEPTAGAYIGAGFADLDRNVVLMFPTTGKAPNPFTPLIEGHPVPPDVAVPWAGPYAGRQDPVIEAGIAEAIRLVRSTVRNSSGFGTSIWRGGAGWRMSEP